jgi:hypothetical protein
MIAFGLSTKCLPQIVGLVRCVSCPLAGQHPIDLNSQLTVGFSERESCVGKRLAISDEPGGYPLAVEMAVCQISLVRGRASESRKNECRRFRGMGTVLAGVADREVVESGIHDLDSFVRMSAADQDQAELEASLGILLE